MQRMESSEFTRGLAQRLDTQEALPEIMNEVFRFKAAADKALVGEGLAVEILQLLVDDRVGGILRQASPMPGMRLVATPMDYRGILKQLLSSYLSEDKCEDHYRALRTATAQPWEDEQVFRRRIHEID
eukprot:contig_666_g44